MITTPLVYDWRFTFLEIRVSHFPQVKEIPSLSSAADYARELGLTDFRDMIQVGLRVASQVQTWHIRAVRVRL